MTEHKVREQITALVKEHRLEPEHNPGGIRLWRREGGGIWGCIQLSGHDTPEDLAKVQAFVAQPMEGNRQ